MLLSSLDPIRLFILPPVLMLISTFSLLTFQNVLLGLSYASRMNSSNQVMTYIKPFLKNLERVIGMVFGKAESIKFNATHVLLMCIVISVITLTGAVQDRPSEARTQKAKRD